MSHCTTLVIHASCGQNRAAQRCPDAFVDKPCGRCRCFHADRCDRSCGAGRPPPPQGRGRDGRAISGAAAAARRSGADRPRQRPLRRPLPRLPRRRPARRRSGRPQPSAIRCGPQRSGRRADRTGRAERSAGSEQRHAADPRHAGRCRARSPSTSTASQRRCAARGIPPPGPPPVLNVLVGDAAAGQAYFKAKCGTCHSATGDLRGIGSRFPIRRRCRTTGSQPAAGWGAVAAAGGAGRCR